MRWPGLLVMTVLAIHAVAAQTYLSPCVIVLAPDSNLVMAAFTGEKLLRLDVQSGVVSETLPLPGQPTGLAQSADGKTLYVTGGGHEGRVWVVDTTSWTVVGELQTGHTPMSPVLSPDGHILYVCNRFDNDISFIDLRTGQTTARIPVVREPVAMDITPDGHTLFVANHLPAGRADVDYVASAISAIHTQTKEAVTIPLVNGAEGMRGLKVSPDGRYVYATHLMARFLVPTTQLERGWVSTDALSVVRVDDLSLQYTVLLDDVDQGFPNPWAIGFTDDGRSLVVSSAGLNELSLIDLPAMMKKVADEAKESNSAAHLDAHNDLSFLAGIRKRIKLKGKGPRAFVVDGATLYVAHYFSDTVERVQLTEGWHTRHTVIPLGRETPLTPERQGEIFFNDAELCFQNWLSCATCHPGARTDALNWDLLNDGIGNPKNAKSMLLAHQTPPAMSTGIRADAETGVRAGLKHIQFSVRPETDAEAIDAYLKSLTPVPSPALVDGHLSPAARRGEQVFEQASCTHCHPAPLYTDLEKYDLKTGRGQDTGVEFDVPILVEVWRTAPYLHDGRAATLKDLVDQHNPSADRGKTPELTEQEKLDLVEFIRSL